MLKKIILIVVLQTSKTPQYLLKLLAEGLPLPLEEKPTSLYRQMRTTSILSHKASALRNMSAEKYLVTLTSLTPR